MTNQQGQIAIILIIGVLVFASLLLFKSVNSPQNSTTPKITNSYCQPDVIFTPDGKLSTTPFTIPAKDYTITKPGVVGQNPVNIQRTTIANFALIKSNVPMAKKYFNDPHFLHFSEDPLVQRNGIQYEINYPGNESSETIYNRSGTNLPDNRIVFEEYGILFLFNKGPDGKNYQSAQFQNLKGDPPDDFYFADIYQRLKPGTTDTLDQPLPPDVLNCQDNNPNSPNLVYNNQTPTQSILYPSQNPATSPRQLQLEYFVPKISTPIFNSESWYMPHCKPAIYLYPPSPALVNVKINTKGFLTYTDPVYPKSGWDVTAYPSGELLLNNVTMKQSNNYDYLYYESKIPDSLTPRPKNGFVAKYEDLPKLFDDLLPKLGLIDKEATEFKAYWIKNLPKSPYYLVSIIPEQQIDFIEPLTVTPTPDTNIRVRFYFEALDSPAPITPPQIITPKRSGFTLVEWGGMVKIDKNHPFTCSM